MGVGSATRLDAASFGSRLYLARLRRIQDAFAISLRAEVPAARVERRYAVVLDALAVRLPVRALARVERLPGVAAVYPVATYRAAADTVPAIVGAVPLWGPARTTAGQGIKVGIIDDGIDAGAPFLAPAGLRPPAGFPRGQRRFTSGRVIVARSFAGRDAPGSDHLAFDPNVSEHGTHVSGIVAGAYGTIARPGLGLPVVRGLSGVAPGAWLGNYRGLARGNHESGAIGSTVELAAAVDRAVADGMDVLNLSLGGPQIDPAADALSMALANAARAGVPSVVAAGNDFDSGGYGSISSPGTSATAITVAATSTTRVFGVRGRVSGAGSPGLAPFAAVPTLGPRVPAALGSFTRLVGPEAYGLDRRACRQPSRRRALRAVVVVMRGGCAFGAKAINAREAGAELVIVASDRPGPPFVVEEETDLPLLVVTDAVGKELRAYIARARAGRARAPDAQAGRAADPAARPDGLLLGGADAVRPPAQARRRRPRRGDPLVHPARLARLPRCIRLLGGHLDGGARRHRRGRAHARAAPGVDARADPRCADRLRRARVRRLERHRGGIAAARRRWLRERVRSDRTRRAGGSAADRLRAAGARSRGDGARERDRRRRRSGSLAGRRRPPRGLAARRERHRAARGRHPARRRSRPCRSR